MFHIKQILHFLKTKGSLSVIILFSVIVFLFLTQNYESALLKHASDNGFDELLTVVIGVLATIIVTTFSAIVVALQLASAQFSPRILRGFFSEDGKVQFFLMSYFLCISYCLTVKFLGLVHVQDTFQFLNFRIQYAPLGIIIGILLILIVFPVFIYYIVSNINVAHIINKISSRTIYEINLMYEKEWQFGDLDRYKLKLPENKDNFLKIKSEKNGFLDSINPFYLGLINLLHHKIYMVEYVGGFVSKGTTVAYIDYTGNNTIKQKLLSFFVNRGMNVNYYRSYTQDIIFGIRQLVDIAIKAISPAINDPTTAINCLNYLGEILKEFVHCKFPARNTQEFKHINIFINEFSIDRLVDQSFDQIYYWGRSDYLIVRHIIDTITHVIEVNKNPNNLAVLIQEVIDMELMNKSFSELKAIYTYDEYVKSLNTNFLSRFSREALQKIEQFEQEYALLADKTIYIKSAEKLSQQKQILTAWPNQQNEHPSL